MYTLYKSLKVLLRYSVLQRLPLQHHLDLFGVQSLVSEQRVGQLLVLLAVLLQDALGAVVRVLKEAQKKIGERPACLRLNKAATGAPTFSKILTSCSMAACVSGLCLLTSL